MPGPDVRHHVGRLLAAEIAIGAQEARRLAALELVMPGHIALDSKALLALGTTERLVGGALRMIGISHATVVIAAFDLEVLAGLKHQVQIQLRPVKT